MNWTLKYQYEGNMDGDMNINMMEGLYLCLGPVTWIFLNTIEAVNEAFVQRSEDFAGRYQITSGREYFLQSLLY